MFNAIEDSIFLIKEEKVSFVNKPAQRQFRNNPKDSVKNILNEPIFYLFSDLNGEESKSKKKGRRAKTNMQQMKEKCLSINDLLVQRIEIVNNNVFTNSKEISESKQID